MSSVLIARYNAAMRDEIDLIVDQWQAERPDLDVSATHVLQRIARLYLLQSSSFAGVFTRFGLTFGEYEVLATLRRSGPPYHLNPTRLFSSIVLSSGAMTNRVDRLEAAGLVERLPDPDDRRGRLVALTERGRAVVDEAVVAHIRNEERLLSGMDPADRERLAGLLRRLLTSEPFASMDPAGVSHPQETVDADGARAARRRRRSTRRPV